jgi:hypothetical protein
MGHVFEDMVRQGWLRHRSGVGLPMVAEWGRWEGSDRDGERAEVDVVARLTGGAMLTGAIKWNREPVSHRLHRDHLRDLKRLARSGFRWAHEAREGESRFLYVAAGGFEDGFLERAEEDGFPVTAWTIEDLYPGQDE